MVKGAKFQKRDWVTIKETGQLGRIQRVLPHPYVPDWLNWLVTPNYIVEIIDNHEMVDEETTDIFKQSELKWREL